ncbi:unnamed protein product [Lampetra fluviatilis]
MEPTWGHRGPLSRHLAQLGSRTRARAATGTISATPGACFLPRRSRRLLPRALVTRTSRRARAHGGASARALAMPLLVACNPAHAHECK